MIASARAELLRLGKWPVTWVIVGVWLALNLFFGYVLEYLTYRDAVSGGDPSSEALLSNLSLAGVPSTVVSGMPMFGGALVLTLAALATGGGYGWNTWKTVFTQGPRRAAAFGGTMLALALLLVVLVAVTLVVDVAASIVLMNIESHSLARPGIGEYAQGLGATLLIAAMWTAAGALIGIVAKAPALSVGLGLVWALAVENLLRGVAGVLGPFEVVTDVLPGTAAGSLAGAIGAAEVSDPGGTPGVLNVLASAAATGWLVGYLVVFTGLAALLLSYRDA